MKKKIRKKGILFRNLVYTTNIPFKFLFIEKTYLIIKKISRINVIQ